MVRTVKPNEDWCPSDENANEAFKIACAVAQEYDMDVKKLYIPGRAGLVSEARFMVWHICSNRGMTKSNIGRLFKRHHGAVMHGLKQFANLLEYDRKVLRRWDRMKALLDTDKLANEWQTEIHGTATVRSNKDLSEQTIAQIALNQVETGQVPMRVSKIVQQEQEAA